MLCLVFGDVGVVVGGDNMLWLVLGDGGGCQWHVTCHLLRCWWGSGGCGDASARVRWWWVRMMCNTLREMVVHRSGVVRWQCQCALPWVVREKMWEILNLLLNGRATHIHSLLSSFMFLPVPIPFPFLLVILHAVWFCRVGTVGWMMGGTCLLCHLFISVEKWF
jgi:hypothetical protein